MHDIESLHIYGGYTAIMGRNEEKHLLCVLKEVSSQAKDYEMLLKGNLQCFRISALIK